jgi:hypothetical protein
MFDFSLLRRFRVKVRTRDKRAHRRRRCTLDAHLLKVAPSAVQSTICDVSPLGCSVHTAEPLAPGTLFELLIVGFAPVEAEAVWSDGAKVGCRFIEPIDAYRLNGLIAPPQAL